jgi:hypothetical protein
MTTSEMREALLLCSYPGYEFAVLLDGRGEIYLQAAYSEPDTVTGAESRQLTRRWFLSPEMTKSELVQTAFKCIITSMEHRVREWFRYAGNAVFSPHYDVDALWELCEKKMFVGREKKL